MRSCPLATQCDQKRTFQIHDGTKRYMVASTETAPPAAAAASEPVPEETAAPAAVTTTPAVKATETKPADVKK